VLASRVRTDLIHRTANITFDGIADNQDPELLGVYGEVQGMAIALLTSAGESILLGSPTADYLSVAGG